MASNRPITILTVREVANYLQIHQSTVYKLLRQQQLPGFRVGTDWRFHKERIDQWMAGKTKPV